MRQEADKVARVTGGESDPDFAVLLHAADAGTVAGSRIEDDERALHRINLDAGRRHDPEESVIDGPLEAAPVENGLKLEVQDVRRRPRKIFKMVVPAAAEHVEEQDRTLPGVNPIFLGLSDDIRARERICVGAPCPGLRAPQLQWPRQI